MRAWLLAFMLFCHMVHAEPSKVIACDNGIEMIDLAVQIIDHAEQSIEFCPCFCGGEIFQQIFVRIEQKMRQYPNLKAYILISPMFLEPLDKDLIQRLCQQYPRQFFLTYTTVVLNCNNDLTAIDNHVKMLVVDETYFIVGGTNYDYALCSEGVFTPPKREKNCAVGPGLPAGARDQDIVGRGPLARELRQNLHRLIALWKNYHLHKRFVSLNPDDYASSNAFFEINLQRRPYVVAFETHPDAIEVEDGKLSRILSGPMHNPNLICERYCRLIDEAQEEIWIGNLHFAPVDPIFESLLRAVNRGVKVVVITNGVHDQSPVCTRPISVANTLYYLPLMYGKKYSLWDESSCKKDKVFSTEIYQYSVPEVIYHKKVMLVDNKTLLIGSYNLGLRSNVSDYELVTVIESPQLAQKTKKILERDLKFSRRVTPQQAREWYFDFFTSYEAELQRQFNNFF